MKNTEKALIQYDLDKPAQVAQMANVLKEHVIKHSLYTPIVGKNYVHVEGWTFAGGLMGLYPRVVEIKKLDEAPTWLAEVEIVNSKTDKTVSRGFALCSKKESKKANFDEYAILSMAQTRAVGKAYRNLIGWVMKLAGYEATPAEEVQEGGEKMKGKITLAIEQTKKFIETTTNTAGLIQLDKKVWGNKFFSAEQRKELSDIIHAKVDAINAKKGK